MRKNKDKKGKKLQKVAKFLYEEFRGIEKSRYENEALVKESEQIELNYAEFDENVSNKFKIFILNLIKLKDKIRVEIRSHCIFINGNLDGFDRNSMSMSKASIDDVIDIRITKEGFSMSRNYAQTISYKDPNIYSELFEKIQEKSKEINKDILLDMIDDVMVKTNLSRQSNLDEILN
jgi:hypothetical protein